MGYNLMCFVRYVCCKFTMTGEISLADDNDAEQTPANNARGMTTPAVFVATVIARGAVVAVNHVLPPVRHLVPSVETSSKVLSYACTGSATTLGAPSMVLSLGLHVVCDGYDLATKPDIDKRKVVLQYVGWTVAGGFALVAAAPFWGGIGALGTIVAVAGEGGYYAVKAFG
jgi:hypothetical protein